MGGSVMKAKSGSTWYNVKEFKRKNGSSWTTIANVKILGADGKWHESVPPNAVILYDLATIPSTATLCNGSNSTTNMLGKYVNMRGDGTNLLKPGGSEKHDGSKHGYFSGYTDYTNSTMGAQVRNFFGSQTEVDDATPTYHRHTIPSHQHTGEATHHRPRKCLQPTMFDDVIRKDAVILSRTSLSTSLFTTVNYNRFLYLSNGNGYIDTYDASKAHTHNTCSVANISTGYYDLDDNKKTNNDGKQAFRSNHFHYMIHNSPSSGTLALPTVNFITGKTIKNITYWDELPSGSVCMFTTTLLPSGWERLNINDYFVYLSSNNNSSSASYEHTHKGQCKTTNNEPRYNTGPNSGSSGAYQYGTHAHTWTDDHSGKVDHRPPFMNFYLAYKQ